MGSNQSSHAKPATESVKEEEKQTLFSVRGLVPKNKTTQDEQAAHEETVEDETPVIVSHAAVLSEDEEPILVEAEISEEESESDSEESDLEDEEDEDEEDELAERRRIFADARALKNLATAFLHPEAPVKVSPESFGRNYFNRASAPETEDFEDAEERAQALADAAALKRLAVDYMHPEVGVKTTDGASMGRNYFNRASAPETEDFEYAEERAQALADAAALKRLAVDYMHPEMGVSSISPEVFGRNYYDRASAPGHTEISSTGSRLGDNVMVKPNVSEKHVQREQSDDESSMHRISSAAMLFGLDNAVA